MQQKIMVPYDTNPQGPWAKEVAEDAWEHPKRKGRAAAKATDVTHKKHPRAPSTKAEKQSAAHTQHPKVAPDSSNTGGNDLLYEIATGKVIDAETLDILFDSCTASPATAASAEIATTNDDDMPAVVDVPASTTESPTEAKSDSEWTLTGSALEFRDAESELPKRLELSDRNVRFEMLNELDKEHSGVPCKNKVVAECIARLCPEKAMQLKQILAIEFGGKLAPGFDEPLITRLAVSVFRDWPLRLQESKSLWRQAAELRKSFSQLLDRFNTLEEKRQTFVAVAYDGLLDTSRKILASVDERANHGKANDVEQEVIDKSWTMAILNTVAALINTTEDGSWQEQSLFDPANTRKKYVVRAHDTLKSIARKQLKSSKLDVLIYQINREVIPARLVGKKKLIELTPGLELYLPNQKEIAQFNKDI